MDWSAHMDRIVERIGEDASYTHEGRAAITVRGVFSNPSRLMMGAMIEGSDPTFDCMSADVPDVAHGDKLVLHSTTYKVVRTEPDSVSGLVKLSLEKQPA